MENNNIKYLRSSPYHPQSNGCCEAVHKEVKSYLLRAKHLNKDKFDLEISIEDAIDFHNNRVLKSTGYKPVDLRDNNDEMVIKEVVENVIKSMKRKIKVNNKLKKNTMLLLCNDIEIKNNRYDLKHHKSKRVFNIPAILMNYKNSNTLEVQIKVNYNNSINFIKDEIINISSNSCRIIDDFGFYYYLKENGEDINMDNLNKYALLE